MNAQCLDYRNLPGQSPFFLKFLYNYEEVAPWYQPVHLSMDRLKERADWVQASPPPYPRDRLVSLLDRMNPGAAGRARSHFKTLLRPEAVAVVTGQQLGLFGGPALSVYKAATAVRLAQLLEAEGYPAVPIFWMPSDDSDFMEVRSTFFFSSRGGLSHVHYPSSNRNTERMVGTIPLEAVQDCFQVLIEAGVQGEFSEWMVSLLRDTYRPERTFREAFQAWMSRLFEDWGLLFFDPLQDGYKGGLTSVFSGAIRKRREMIERLARRAEEIRNKILSVQVQTEDSETFLFWIDKNRRFKLECVGERYRAKGSHSDEFSPRELVDELRKNPQKVSSNVLLRPILQDHLLPTVVYVGGPSEIAYFSQVEAISSIWDRGIAVFPRAGITVVDRKAQRWLKQYGLGVEDFFSLSRPEMLDKILRRVGTTEILEKFDRVGREFKGQLESLDLAVRGADPSVSQMLGVAERKISYQLGKVRNRFLINSSEGEVHLTRHLDYLANHLYPEGRLQERRINFNQFLSLEGKAFVTRLVDSIQPFCMAHQVLYV